jgi:hypothetical protein
MSSSSEDYGESVGYSEDYDEESQSEDVPYYRYDGWGDQFRGVAVKTARVKTSNGRVKTVLASVAVSSPQPWRASSGASAVLFASHVNGGTLVAGGLSGAPGMDASDLVGAPAMDAVAAVVAGLLKSKVLVAHQPSLVLKLLAGHLQRSELAGVFDLSGEHKSLREALISQLDYSLEDVKSCSKWHTGTQCVAVLQCALDMDCPFPSLPKILEDEVDEYLIGLDGLDLGYDWISFSELGSILPLPAVLRSEWTYPAFFENVLTWSYEVSSDRKSARFRDIEFTGPMSELPPPPVRAPLPRAPVASPAPPEPAARAMTLGEYEAIIVATLSGKGWVQLATLGQLLPAAPPGRGTSLGRFVEKRPQLFVRMNNYVALLDELSLGDEDEDDDVEDDEDEDDEDEDDAPFLPHAALEAAFAAMGIRSMMHPTRMLIPSLPRMPPQQAPAPRAEPVAEPPLGPHEANLACCVCMERRKVGAFLPCMHRCCCMWCGERVMQARDAVPRCPVCRAPVGRFARVFD